MYLTYLGDIENICSFEKLFCSGSGPKDMYGYIGMSDM